MKKIVGLTGISGSIGQALCHELISENYFIIGFDKDSSQFDKLQSHYGESIKLYELDLLDKEQTYKLLDDIQRESPIDIWINNAGISHTAPFHQIEDQAFQKVMDINFHSLVSLSSYWTQQMMNRDQSNKGKIINIASVAGHVASPNLSSYVASKFATVGFTKTLQLEAEVYAWPIDFILVSPGFVESQIMNVGKDYGFPEELQKIVASPASCAKEIIQGIKKNKLEITPTLNGKAVMQMNKFLPGTLKLLGKQAFKKVKK